MKDNCDFYVLKEKATKFLKEVNYYTENKMDCYFVVDTIIILEEGKMINPLKSHKMDTPYLESDDYLKDIIRTNEEFDNRELSSTTPYDEFITLDQDEKLNMIKKNWSFF